ncbi:hypothetical protein SDRG_08063 [Saprolegnia diclina VS20]|uniref:RNI-like protein n=1 Tax=Saprolegnia diclina (strain VS20) TaxID=1156394 RepID=T0QKG8_SAPDV|nr:hypothetical protein SDRG_08063 [Saprolegnia diclina VS20]EQC34290.1 hypothetical protein SDRG_08063 [Saprolegnia diclina VS20]|eukprot:XP_008612152.1 hypothetical protein SDRG_08063 [Saprolegnia diclina VS20]
MSTKRTCPEAATMLGLPHVLISIVQCLSSPRDAIAFLMTLPPASLHAPLAATKALLTQSGPFAYTWPHLSLDDLHSESAALALEALPALLSALEPEPDSNVWATCDGAMSFVDFVSSWPLTVTHIDTLWPRNIDSTNLCRLLRRCTRLRSIDISNEDKDVVEMLTAVTTPAHRLKKLSVFYQRATTMDWTSLLRPWLSSGYARHLAFDNTRTTDMEGLARALATTSSLTGLDILNNDDLVGAFLTLQMPLHQLTSVYLWTQRHDRIRPVLQLLNVTKLTSLALNCMATDYTDVLTLVPRMTALRHLLLDFGKVCDLDASRWPHLESIELSVVNWTSKAFGALLKYLERVQGLRKLKLDHCDIVYDHVADVSLVLRRLIYNGLTLASLIGTGLDDARAATLARMLRQSRNPLPVTLHLKDNEVTIGGVRWLLKALATCSFVRVVIDTIKHADLHAAAATYGMACDMHKNACMLYSPFTIS